MSVSYAATSLSSLSRTEVPWNVNVGCGSCRVVDCIRIDPSLVKKLTVFPPHTSTDPPELYPRRRDSNGAFPRAMRSSKTPPNKAYLVSFIPDHVPMITDSQTAAMTIWAIRWPAEGGKAALAIEGSHGDTEPRSCSVIDRQSSEAPNA
jgi:hypothetical protein